MHRGARGRHLAGDHALCGTLVKQRHRQLSYRLRRCPLSHPDQHAGLADGHHIATFERCRAKILIGIAPPDFRFAGETGMETVDGGGNQRLLLACGPVHRVQGNTAINPTAGVAGEYEIGQRRQDKSIRSQKPAEHAMRFKGQVMHGDAARQKAGEFNGRHLIQPAAQLVHHANADVVLGDLAVQKPLPRPRLLKNFCQQVMLLQHLDPPITHFVTKGEVIFAGLIDPKHIVKQ